jgi:hypothetical protein
MDTSALLERLKAIVATAVARVVDFARAWPLALVCAVALWLIATPNPILSGGGDAANASKLGIFAWLICKVAGLAYLGYWIDRLLHPHSRPSQFRTDPSDSLGTTALDVARMAAEKRRAFIVGAAMLSAGLIQ